MAAEPKVIPVAPGSELDGIIEEATQTTVVQERTGGRFRLVREEDIDPFANYDPERVLRAFERASGMFAGMDVEALKADLREQRGQDSRGRPA